jgi:hypothetical protein
LEFATNFTNWHEFFLLIRVNSCNSWQKRPTAQLLSVLSSFASFASSAVNSDAQLQESLIWGTLSLPEIPPTAGGGTDEQPGP